MRSSPVLLLVVLTSLNFVNYLDRYEMAAVLGPVSESLQLTKLQGGLLATVFLLSFLLTCPLFGALGDRYPRKVLLFVGALVWSLATFGSGLARDATTLFVARALVGVGEASFTTLAPTVIDDVAPDEKRTRWLALFHLAAPVGSALGYIVGGLVAHRYGWHNAFFVGGIPGLLLGVVLLTLTEPARRGGGSDDALPTGDWKTTVRALLGLRAYRATVFGYTAQTFAVGAFAFWAPTFLLIRFDAGLAKANLTFGAVTVVAGLLATLCGGWLGDRRQRQAEATLRSQTERSNDGKPYRENAHEEPSVDAVTDVRNRALLSLSARAALPSAILALLCFLAPSATLFFILAFFTEFFVFFSNAPINAAILRTVPSHLRARGMAYCIFSIHLFGDLWSPAFVGLLADKVGNAKIQWAMLPLPVAFTLAAWFWWRGSRTGAAREPA